MFLSTHTRCIHTHTCCIHTHAHPASLAWYQSSPGHPGWWRGNRTCTSWQAERALCAGWTGIWLPCCALNAPCSQRSTARNHNKNTNKTRRKNEKGGAPQSGCSLRSPITEDCKEIHFRETPPPPFPKHQQPSTPLPLPLLAFLPLLLLLTKERLTVSSCSLVFSSSGGIAQHHSAVLPRPQCFHIQTEVLRLATEPQHTSAWKK